MRLKIIVVSALTAIVVGIAAPGAGAADPADNGNCLSSFVNGGAQGSQVSSDPGGAQASGELANFCARPAGAAEHAEGRRHLQARRNRRG